MKLSIASKKGAELRVIWNADSRNEFRLALYETMLETTGGKTKDLGMFPSITLQNVGTGFRGSITQRGVTTQMEVWPEGETLLVKYTVTVSRNTGLLQIHPCLMTTYAPDYIGKRRGTDYREMGNRIMLAMPETTALSRLGGDRHQAASRKGGWVAAWAWWVYARKRFTRSIVELRRRSGSRRVVIDGCATTHISSNMGDKRSCLHHFPQIGALAAGKSKTVTQRYRLLA